ncbi:MAG: 30S ribosomal protein S6 [Chloroflexota bacterium]
MPNEASELIDYEMMVVIKPEFDAEKLDAAVENINRIITNRAGTVSEIERRGKKRLAYPIKHYAEGNYVLAKFKMKPASGKELEKELAISENILRHLLIKVEA